MEKYPGITNPRYNEHFSQSHGTLLYSRSIVMCHHCQKKARQGSRLMFQLSSQVASERFDFTSQNKFALARLFLQNLLLCSICLIFSRVKYCKHASLSVISRVKNLNVDESFQRLKILTRGRQSAMCLQDKFPGAM